MGMIPRELVQTGDVPASGPLILDLGAAVAGFRWDLRRLVLVENPSPETPRAATVFVVTPASNLPGGVLDPTEIADVTSCGTPAAASWSRETIVLRAAERVQVWAYGLPVGLSFVATAQVEEDRA